MRCMIVVATPSIGAQRRSAQNPPRRILMNQELRKLVADLEAARLAHLHRLVGRFWQPMSRVLAMEVKPPSDVTKATCGIWSRCAGVSVQRHGESGEDQRYAE
jgi:hypothetical protein